MMRFMTSDHGVAGSSPAGCSSGLEADWQSIMVSGNREAKSLLSFCYRIFEFYSTEFPGICGQVRAIYSRPNMRFRYKISWYNEAHPSQTPPQSPNTPIWLD